MNIEKFERRVGGWFAALGIIWLPIPFLGIFTLLQLILFIILGIFLGFKDQAQLIGLTYQAGIIFAIIELIFFIIGIFVLIKFSKYKSPGMWVRLICYFFSIVFHLGFYALQFMGPRRF